MYTTYSTHAEDQLKERELSKELADQILLNPMQVLESKKGRKIAQSIVKFEKKAFLIRVVYIERPDHYNVITVYKTSRIKKYWRE